MKIRVEITRAENAKHFNVNIGDIVNVEIEEYVAAVVASEIGNSNIEACKAQAIAARTFAIARGVLAGKVISDSSQVAQAYRAPRYNSAYYQNCIDAANATSGIVLTYKDKPISAVYSSCNGGRTVSAKEHWGSSYAYLIAQDDPWDAATGKTKNGHGVGMSQVGAVYAGAHDVTCEEILEFYYPGTALAQYYWDDNVQLRELYEVLAQVKGQLDDIL